MSGFDRVFHIIEDRNARTLAMCNRGVFNCLSDKQYLKIKYRACIGEKLNLQDPKGFNEKLQWLKLYDRKAEYTMMVDKYLVRDYIAQQLGEEYLIPLLGVWDDPDEIDFDALPNQFVLKCNHNSGLGMCICKDKSKLDIVKVKAELRKGLAQNYYLSGREWPYKDVPRKIICEKFMADESGSDLKDYKFYCFNGKVKLMLRVSDRFGDVPAKGVYVDRNFNVLPIQWGFEPGEISSSKFDKFDEMCILAEKLSQNIPHVRIDLYLIGQQIYFGEMTFFDGSGFDAITPKEWDEKLGRYITLPR